MFRIEWFTSDGFFEDEHFEGTLDEAYQFAEENVGGFDGYTVSKVGMRVTVY